MAASDSDGAFTMNDSGTIAFRRGNGTAVTTLKHGLVTPIADSSGAFNNFGSAPSLNSDGTVAFVAGTNGRDGGVFGIYKGNGGR